MVSRADKQWKTPTDVDIDRTTNAAFTAFTTCLGRPFKTGKRNIRAIVREWCPLVASITSEMEPAVFRSAYLPAHFFDRYIYAAEKDASKDLQREALDKLLLNVERGRIANNALKGPGRIGNWLDTVLAEASLICQRVLGEFSLERVFEKCRHGPNSTTTIRKNEAFLDVKTFDLTGTSGAVDAFVKYLAWDTLLRDYLAEAYLSLPLEWSSVQRVRGNTISFVPNKFDKLRTMASESTLSMFFQLGTGEVISDCLRQHANIDLGSQPDAHRNLVQLMTAFPEIGDATIDWSEASDRIWIALIQRLVSADWFEWLCSIRSEVSNIRDPHTGEMSEVVLPMIGTMGNGFTFPLQTLVFWSLLCGLARTENVRELGISVFGDDCIVPIELVPGIERLAEELSWKMNSTKSFSTGGFRESCGRDCYRGMDVRPFFIERPADLRRNTLKSWIYIAVNGMTHRLGLTDPPREILDWAMEAAVMYDLGKLHVVPPRWGDNTGIRITDPKLVSLIVPGSEHRFFEPRSLTEPKQPLADATPRPFVPEESGKQMAFTRGAPSSWKSAQPYPGFAFLALTNSPGDRPVVTEYPFYRRVLAGLPHTEPDDWRVAGFSDVSTPTNPWEGVVTLKGARYRTRQFKIHEWVYWLP